MPYYIGLSNYDPSAKWQKVEFPKGLFETDEIAVFLTVQSQKQIKEWFPVRLDGITRAGFTYLGETAKKNGPKHTAQEVVGFFAIPVGSGSINGKRYVAGVAKKGVDHRWRTIKLGEKITNPAVFEQIVSVKGGDTSTMRLTRIRKNVIDQIRTRLQEPNGPKCGFRKGRHVQEQLAWMVVGK